MASKPPMMMLNISKAEAQQTSHHWLGFRPRNLGSWKVHPVKSAKHIHSRISHSETKPVILQNAQFKEVEIQVLRKCRKLFPHLHSPCAVVQLT